MAKNLFDYDSTQLLRDIGDMLLRIEIDTDMWVGKPAAQKLNYLKKKIFDNNGKVLNVGSRLLECVFGVIKNSTKNPAVRSYVNLAEMGMNLAKASMVINNTFISQRYEAHTDYDELAKFMGYKNGHSIYTRQIDATVEICKALIEMSKESQQKYGMIITKMNNPKGGSGTKDGPYVQTTFMLCKFNGVKIGYEINYVQNKKNGSDVESSAEFSYINMAVAVTDIVDENGNDNLSEAESIIYSNYISTIDVTKNIIKIDGSALHTAPRVDVNFDIHNINIAEMSKTCRAVLTAKKRRGYILQGDPGTGKTVSIHKLIMDFTDVPVFWISPDAISDTKRMRSVFKILNMFPGSIFVFDDIDGNDMSGKNALTSTFITCIDSTNSKKFSGILILTINEPQRIHSTIKTRTERIDEVLHVRNPYTIDQVADVVAQRYVHLGVAVPEWVANRSDEFVSGAEKMIGANFTHADVAGIISDLVDLNPDGYEGEDFIAAIDKRVMSICNARMMADCDGHIMARDADLSGKSNVRSLTDFCSK